MPNIDPETQAAAERAVRRANARSQPPQHTQAVRNPLSEALLEERCCDHGPSPEDPVLNMGRAVRGGSKKSASKIQADVSRILSNPTENAAKLELAAGDLARSVAGKQVQVIDEAIGLLSRHIGEMDAEIHSLLQPPTTELRGLAPEIRVYLRGLPEKERDELLARTGSDDYHALMYAVASAPAWMSGVAEGQKMGIRSTILGLRRPQLLTMPKQYRRELDLLKQCREGFERSIGEMVDFGAVDAIRSLMDGA